jgi:hypothetical protein
MGTRIQNGAPDGSVRVVPTHATLPMMPCRTGRSPVNQAWNGTRKVDCAVNGATVTQSQQTHTFCGVFYRPHSASAITAIAVPACEIKCLLSLFSERVNQRPLFR